MIDTFTFVRTAGTPDTAYLTRTAMRVLGRNYLGRTVLAHGVRRLDVSVVPIEEEGHLLPVAPPTADALGLIEGIPYRLRLADGEIRVGPVIGILAARRSDQIDPNLGGLPAQFLLRYPAVGGLVFLFGAEHIDVEAETIEGYCWVPGDSSPTDERLDPEWARARRLAARVRAAAAADGTPAKPHPRTERFLTMAREFQAETPLPEPRGRWTGASSLGEGRLVWGRFPYPGAVWRRAGFLKPEQWDQLVLRLGARIFNSHFFAKSEGYRLMAAHPSIRPHLPEIEPFEDMGQLFARLARDERLILKQTDGNSAYGLIRIDRNGEGFRLRFRERPGTVECQDRTELGQHLEPLIRGGHYLLQQCINLPSHAGRLNDYRVMMQKDGRGAWQPMGIMGRFGRRDGIVTNFVNDGYALPADQALQRAFGVGAREAYRLERDLIQFALAVCEALDTTGGHYGDVGLDVGIDLERHLWLFEITKLPFHELPLYMGDEQMYLAVKSGPLLYAAHLAGFGA